MITSLPALKELTTMQWLFVKITDSEGRVGWGESSLEGT
jgi:L-alanine-DL-glutamate epimerase-like enolase superfamily enzyme